MNKELNAAEAVYGFVGWLTSREERTVMSAKDDCAPIAELIKRFCTENNLPEVSDQWPLNLIHPSGEVAVPNAALATPTQAAALVSPSDDGFMAAVNEMDGLYAARQPAALPAGEYPELPEWSKRDDLGGLVPSEVRQALRAYVDADRAARGRAKTAPVDAAAQQDAERWKETLRHAGINGLELLTAIDAAIAARAAQGGA